MTEDFLQQFDTDLRETIKKFGEDGKIFSNEEQFQFELAWKLKEKGYNVRLEVLSCSEPLEKIAELSKEGRDKMYTDIVVDISDDESIAIELKYKTIGNSKTKFYEYATNGRKTVVFHQGANNIGRYLFLKDVERLEKLVDGKGFDAGFGGKVVRGYAIIISNDDAYWLPQKNEKQKEEGQKEENLMEEFSTFCGKTIEGTMYQHVKVSEKDKYIILDGKDKSKGKDQKVDEKFIEELESRLKKENRKKNESEKKILSPITLKGSYKCVWENYYCEKSYCKFRKEKGERYNKLKPGFGYLILQIPPKETN